MNKTSFSQKPIFWILFTIISLLGVAFSFKYFSTALPIVNLDVSMDRNDALKQAKELAHKYEFGPKNFRQATLFASDKQTQIFIELEAGGRKEFDKMLKEKIYEPYNWKVRHFAQSQKNETTISFTPEGKPYGFNETIPEDQPGPKLSAEKAKTLAENKATNDWNVNLEPYKLIESSKEKRPNGRVDHTFVYERKNKQIGEGRYRLSLVVSGEKFTQLEHFVQIPDAFKRRYAQMRATNKSIATASSVSMMLLYIIGGLIGLFFLFRIRYLLWKTPLFFAGLIAILQFATHLNNLPIAWMQYQTNLSTNLFLLIFFVQGIITSFAFFCIATFIFAIAESLTRKAFGNHPQLWSLWSNRAASSTATLGRTIGGYLLVGTEIALVVATYLFATKFLGWWSPSDTLVEPNILATYFPWLFAISTSINAGFIEECLFRAIPLAGAALIGKRYGKRTLWIAIALIVQAIIFGAAHANYATQPAYARLVELIIPSLIFGGVYLAYGLLPTILSHIVFDLVLFSLPIFISSAPGMWIHRTTIIIIGLIPLLIVLINRLRVGKFSQLPAALYNKAWKPTEKKEAPQIKEIPQTKILLSKTVKKSLIISGIIGLIAWGAFTKFTTNIPGLNISKIEAVQIARNELARRKITLSDDWQPLTILFSNYEEQADTNLQHRFTWQANNQLYKKLMKTYISPPQWIIRFVTFNGNDVSQKSEEYLVFIDGNGNVIRFSHKLPENRAGATLEKEAALSIVHKHLKSWLNLNPEKLQKVSASAIKRPSRMDWKFVFDNPSVYDHPEGQARIEVHIGGDEVIDSLRMVHVPEKWQQTERTRQSLMGLVKIISVLFLLLLFLGALVKGKSKTFSVRVAIISFGLLFLHSIFNTFSYWPILISKFNTSEPFGHQIFALVAILSISTLMRSGLMALLFGLVYSWQSVRSISQSRCLLISGFGLGALLLGISSFGAWISPTLKPLWPLFMEYATKFPIPTTITDSLISFVTTATILIITLRGITSFSWLWKKYQFLLPLLSFATGIALAGVSAETISQLIFSGTITGIVIFTAYHFVLRTNTSLIIPVFGVLSAGALIQQAIFSAYPLAALGNVLAAISVILFSLFLFNRVEN